MKRFIITYLVMMGLFFALIGLTPVQRVIDLNGLYTRGVVVATAWLLNLVGISSTAEGSLIHLPGISLDVKFGCNGLEAVMIYAVAIVSYPAGWRQKLKGLAAGFVVIQVVNILRIVALGYAGVHMRRVFEVVHLYIAQGMMIAVALATFIIYLNYVSGKSQPQGSN